MMIRNLFFLMLFFVCSSFNMLFSQNCDKKYEVVKIDSTEGNYLVHIKRAKEKLLLISSKEDVRINNKIQMGDRIKVGGKYKFKLSEYDIKFASIPPEMDQSLSIDGKMIWKKGDDFNLFVSKSLAGLYYIRKPE
ncbi:hypothetical protein [Spongiimicrobium sp. 3-5]|uniref:hypothetical protein n=1 Tax=Spongiimicrobium sp. 3-5 TaxID=3332596 RepID=UPI00397F829B